MMDVRRCELSEVLDLRHSELRQGLPQSEAIFAGDELPTSRHFGAFVSSPPASIAGCASLHLNQWLAEPAWQLRGMATAPSFRGRGVGRLLLEFIERDLLAEPVAPRLLWCNARTPAIGFYERMGWQVMSEVFDIPTAGPHVRMFKPL